jgi:hypothetical protein
VSIPLDQLIGCNVRGRLMYIKDLIRDGDYIAAEREIENLLDFFPDEPR